jgi:hypothetical protein
MDKLSLRCREDCRLLNLSGVLTLDKEDKLEFFCERCDLHP